MGHLRRRYPDVDRIFVSYFFFCFFCFCVFFCILRSQSSRGRKENHRTSFILRKMKVTIGCLALALFLTAWTEAAPRKKQHWEEMRGKSSCIVIINEHPQASRRRKFSEGGNR